MTKCTLLRGGAWDDPPVDCRSAYRDRARPSDAYHDVGFRVGCPAPKSGETK